MSCRPKARRAAGQATVELALGTLVFVTLLTAGIYLAETSFLALKVHEAANYAVWWSTGVRVHQFSGNTAPGDSTTYSPWNSLPARVELAAQTRYANFDGAQAALASGTPLTVSCQRDATFAFKVDAATAPAPADAEWAAVAALVKSYYRDAPGGLSCRASSQIAAFNVPTHFLDDEWNLKDAHWTRAPVPVCGVGRAQNGGCPGRYGVLLGDWSLDGSYGNRSNASLLYAHPPGYNDALDTLVKTLWQTNQGSRGHAASDFASALSGTPSPYDENTYFISSPGYEHFYYDTTTQGLEFRDTRGVYQDRVRGNCFLGRDDGCGSPAPPPLP